MTAAIESGWPGWDSVVLAAYLIGVAALLLRFAICRQLASRLWRSAEPERDKDWQDMISRVSREMHLRRRVELRIARGPAMPMTWGTLAPKVLLPAESRAWPEERRRLVLLHELAHVARRDSLSRSAASLACAFYWFHPGAWLAARQLRIEQEYAADDRVLNAGAAAPIYARNLLDLARRVGEWSWPGHAAAMSGMCQLERRLVSITTPGRREQPGPAFLFVSAAIATSFLLAVAAGVPVRPLPAAPDPLPVDPVLPAARIAPAPGEGRTEPDARLPDRATAPPRTEKRLRDESDGIEAPRAATPPPQPEALARETDGQRIVPAQDHEAVPAEAAAIGRGGPDATSSPQQLGVYGPPRPQQIAEEQDSDPRIPVALRHAGRDGGQGTRPAPSRSSRGGTRIWPRLILGSGQGFPR